MRLPVDQPSWAQNHGPRAREYYELVSRARHDARQYRRCSNLPCISRLNPNCHPSQSAAKSSEGHQASEILTGREATRSASRSRPHPELGRPRSPSAHPRDATSPRQKQKIFNRSDIETVFSPMSLDFLGPISCIFATRPSCAAGTCSQL